MALVRVLHKLYVVCKKKKKALASKAKKVHKDCNMSFIEILLWKICFCIHALNFNRDTKHQLECKSIISDIILILYLSIYLFIYLFSLLSFCIYTIFYLDKLELE